MPKTNKCIFCGKETKWVERFEYGEFPLCAHGDCRNRVVLQISYDSFPVVWLGRDDLYCDDDSGYERMPKEEYDVMESKEIIDIASDTCEALGDHFWEQYDEAVKDALQWRRERIERKKIEDTPEEDLPLLLDTIKSKDNQEIFEKRLRGIKEKQS